MTQQTRTTPLPATVPAARSPWRSIGLWMALILIGYILINSVRAILNPVETAATYGTPLLNPADTAYVMVYAIRSIFLGVFGLALIVRREYRALALFALIGAIMPLGDALLVASQGGPTATVIRHLLTAVFLVATWFFLRRWIQSAAG